MERAASACFFNYTLIKRTGNSLRCLLLSYGGSSFAPQPRGYGRQAGSAFHHDIVVNNWRDEDEATIYLIAPEGRNIIAHCISNRYEKHPFHKARRGGTTYFPTVLVSPLPGYFFKLLFIPTASAVGYIRHTPPG